MTNRKKPAFRKFRKKKRKKIPSKLPKGLRRRITVIPNKKDNQFFETPDITIMVNEFVEETLKKMREHINKSGQARVTIPDMTMEIPGGQVDLTDGFVKDIGSIRQRGKFKVEPTDEGFFISGPLEFEDLYAKFQYSVTVCGIGPSGKIDVDVPDNIVHLKLFAKVDFKEIDDFDLKLTGYDVRVNLRELIVDATGLSVAFNWLLSKIATTLANRHKPRINRAIEEKMEGLLDKFVKGELQ